MSDPCATCARYDADGRYPRGCPVYLCRAYACRRGPCLAYEVRTGPAARVTDNAAYERDKFAAALKQNGPPIHMPGAEGTWK